MDAGVFSLNSQLSTLNTKHMPPFGVRVQKWEDYITLSLTLSRQGRGDYRFSPENWDKDRRPLLNPELSRLVDMPSAVPLYW